MSWLSIGTKTVAWIAGGMGVVFVGLVLMHHGRSLQQQRLSIRGALFLAVGAALLVAAVGILLWRLVVAGPDCEGAGPLLC